MITFPGSSSDDSGQILLLTAFAMLALCGMGALALDIGHAYDTRNKLAMTADAAARSAAQEIRRGNAANYAAFAQSVVLTDKAAGRIPSGASATFRLCSDVGATCLPAYTSNQYVEVLMSYTQPTYVGGVLNRFSVTPTARAVAGGSSGPNCLIALDPAGSISVSNPVGSVTATNCSVAGAGGYDVKGTVTAASISSKTCANGCTGVSYPAPAPSDPLASLAAPTNADCNNGLPNTPKVTVGGTVNLTPGTYNEIEFDSGTLSLAPGIYCIGGEMHPKTAGKDTNIVATGGVLIYIKPSGQLNLGSNHVDVTLSAMTSGTWKGVLFYQDRANTNPVVMSKNNGTWTVNGAVYFPSASVDAKNANWASSNFCGILVAGSIDWAKPNLTFQNTCTDFGGSPLMTTSLAE